MLVTTFDLLFVFNYLFTFVYFIVFICPISGVGVCFYLLTYHIYWVILVKSHCTIAVSYTHLDVYKRQGLIKVHNILSTDHRRVSNFQNNRRSLIEIFKGNHNKTMKKNVRKSIGKLNITEMEMCSNCLLYTSRCV